MIRAAACSFVIRWLEVGAELVGVSTSLLVLPLRSRRISNIEQGVTKDEGMQEPTVTRGIRVAVSEIGDRDTD